MSVSETWNDPFECPFCGENLPSPGAGFVDHVSENAECEKRHENWRDNVVEDMRGGWGG